MNQMECLYELRTDPIYGFKAFESNWSCRGFKYEVGRTYTLGARPIMCIEGFHFCIVPSDCFHYYPVFDSTKMAIVVGNCHTLVPKSTAYDMGIDSKCVTNSITIIEDVTEMVMETAKNYGWSHRFPSFSEDPIFNCELHLYLQRTLKVKGLLYDN